MMPTPYVIVAFAAILVARFLSVYPIVALTGLMGEKLSSLSTNVLALGGLRGAVSVALVLSLPDSNYKTGITAMVFGVALLSLIIQAEILNVYLKRESKEESLGLTDR